MAERVSEQSIFMHAIGLAGAERAAYLDEACSDDPALRAELDALLAADERLGGASPTTDPGSTGRTPVAGGGPYEAVAALLSGRYKLLEQIGEGGMGAVWMAQQIDPVKRLVALKVIKPGMDSRQVLARFEAERQALALMDHPNVAKVLDAGTTAGGLPYFVMELVKGVPITRYCDEHRLTPRQRLELFVPVCQAIQHAHTKGIIHRDVKPSNVLVASYDGVPVPKVIDFGIAKAVGAQLTDRTLITGYGSILGTLEYMSPEQAEFNQLDVDARSDVYSLGVLLYELLTGSTPLQKNRLEHGAILEVLRMIREEEPPRPSTRLSESKDSLPTISAQRQTEPAKLAKLVRGELDWIAMTALEKDRERRYETASAFAADVRRYLADEPVLACPPSAGYRLGKFLRRNKRPVLAVGGLALLLVAGVVGTTAGLVLALAAERRAVAERNDKEVARRQARQALNTMTDEVVEELLGTRVQLTDKYRAFLKKVLSSHAAFAAARADDAEGRQARADGYFRVGRIRYSLGELAEAEEAYREAVALQKPLAEEPDARPELRHALALSYFHLSKLLNDVGKREDAVAALQDALALQKDLAADSKESRFREEVVNTLMVLGIVLAKIDRWEAAEKAWRDALALAQELEREFKGQPEIRRTLAAAHYNLGMLLSDVKRPKDADKEFHESLRIYRKLGTESAGPENRLDLAKSHMTVAVLLQMTGQPKEAAAAWREAIAVGKRLASEFPARPDLRVELAFSYNNLGKLLHNGGRSPEAEENWREALKLFKQLAADVPARPDLRFQMVVGHHNLATELNVLAHHSLATERNDLGRLKQAEEAWGAALAAGERLVADFPSRSDFLDQLADVHVHFGHFLLENRRREEAERHFRRALRRSTGERNEGKVLFCRYNLSIALRLTDHEEAGRAEYRAAFQNIKDKAQAHFDLAMALYPHRLDEAIAEYSAAIQIKDDFPEARVNLGNAQSLKGNPAAALGQYRKAIATKQDFPQIYKAHNGRGLVFMKMGLMKEAIAAFDEAIKINNDFAEAHYNRANALYSDRLEEAIPEYKEAIRCQKDYPEAHSNLGNALARNGELDEAIDHYREALSSMRRFPEASNAHQGLATTLRMKREFDAAIAEYRAALRLKESPTTHYSLGVTLQVKGDPDGAAAEFRKAIALKPDYAEAHCDLGLALRGQGEFRQALKELRLGHKFGSRMPRWPYPSRQLVRHCERLIELERQLPAYLDDDTKAATADQCVELAELCTFKRLNGAATRFWERAFTQEPKLRENLQTRHRYNAACVAARAGCGEGKDADDLSGKERARLRRLALDWLRADLAAWTKELGKNTPDVRAGVRDKMSDWQIDIDFAGVRGKAALAELPDAEADAWQKLWDDVADVQARTQTKTNPKAKPDGK